MATGDLWEVTTRAVQGNQTLLNVYHYIEGSPTTDDFAFAEDLTSAVNQNFYVGPNLFADVFVTTAHTVNRIYARNVFNPAPFHERAINVMGTSTMDAMPIFAAWQIECPRKRADIRTGRKRYGGMTENAQVGGNLTTTALNALANWADKVEQVLNVGPAGLAVPVIVKRIKEVDPETGEVSYRLPQNQLELVFYEATEWVANGRVTTQNTRKVGRGI